MKSVFSSNGYGFTLIEILIVVALIGILSVFVVVASIKSTAKARDAIRKSDIGLVASALEQYYVDRVFNYIPAPDPPGYYDSTSGLNIWIPGLESYFKNMPKDVKQAAGSRYLANGSKTGKVAALQTVILRPNGVGASTTWTPTPSGPNYSKVNEVSADGDGTYVRAGSDLLDLYTIEAGGITGLIENIKVNVVTRGDSGQDPCSYINIRTNSTNYAGPCFQTSIDGVYHTSSYTWATNPSTGAAWTVSDISTLQIGVSKYPNSEARYVTQEWVEVTYYAVTEGPTCVDYGTKYTFTTTFNSEGTGLGFGKILINSTSTYNPPSASPAGAFEAVFNSDGSIGVRDDANNWQFITEGQSAGNSYATLDTTTHHSWAGGNLTVYWDITFKPGWAESDAKVWVSKMFFTDGFDSNDEPITIENNTEYTPIMPLQIPCSIIIEPSTDPSTAPSSSPGVGNYFYAYYSDIQGTYYEIWARLEDLNDPEINTKPTANCKRPVPVDAPIGFNYCMSSRL